MVEHVLCFDRDNTLDVNPPGDFEAVPLSWVKELAHDYGGVHVWATGNQHLCTEAGIPGFSEARAIWGELHGGDIDRYYENYAYHGYKPSRRGGLKLIYDIYHLSDLEPVEFTIVDDRHIGDVSTHTHWLPWNFVQLVRDNDILSSFDPTMGYCNEPVQSNDCTCDVVQPDYSEVLL